MREGFYTKQVQANITRPANTTAYTAGDVVGNASTSVITFPALGRFNGGTGVVNGVVFMDSANQTTKPDLELWLFTKAPAAIADNAAFIPTDAELTSLVGIINLPVASMKVAHASAGAAGSVVQSVAGSNLLYQCAPEDDDLYGILVVRNAYTPVSGEIFTVTLAATLD